MSPWALGHWSASQAAWLLCAHWGQASPSARVGADPSLCLKTPPEHNTAPQYLLCPVVSACTTGFWGPCPKASLYREDRLLLSWRKEPDGFFSSTGASRPLPPFTQCSLNVPLGRCSAHGRHHQLISVLTSSEPRDDLRILLNTVLWATTTDLSSLDVPFSFSLDLLCHTGLV